MKNTKLKTMLTAIILSILMVSTLSAASYAVSGAGTASVNGVYDENGTYNGITKYINSSGATTYYMFSDGSYWFISQYDGGPWINTLYYNYYSTSTPPLSGWSSYYGYYPAPTLAIAQAELSYSMETFTESTSNDGSIDNTSPIIVTHNNYGGDTFTGADGDDFVAGGHIVVTNLPSNLVAVASRTSSTTLSLTLTGSASAHANTEDLSNLTFTFQNSAFSGGDASAVSGSTNSDLSINFIQAYDVASSGGDYTTIAAAMAAAGSGDILYLAGETFTEAGLTASNKSLNFVGQGASSTIVQAAASYNTASDRVFNFSFTSYSSSNIVSFSGMTIRHGKKSGAPGGKGGGIAANQMRLKITDCELNSNLAVTSSGGYYGEGGGAIWLNASDLEATGSTFDGNSHVSSFTGDMEGGGAIAFYCQDAVNYMTITNCTFSGNSAGNKGGAIMARPPVTNSVQITNSTFHGNSAALGGAYMTAGSGANPQPIYFKNTILFGNTASSAGSQLYSSNTTNFTFDNCLIQNTSAGGLAGVYNSCITGSDPLLSALADNGGPTRTMLVAAGSPTIDAGTATGAPSLDQRGYTRSGAADIGAFEFGGTIPITVQTIVVDIKPGSDNNRVNPKSKGVIPVAVLTTAEFDATTLDISSLRFGPGAASTAHNGHFADLDGDGDVDLMLHFRTQATGVSDSDTYLTLTGTTNSGISVEGSDQINGNSMGKGTLSDETVSATFPEDFALRDNFPNPFNPSTIIAYALPQDAVVSLKVFDLRGRLVSELANGFMTAGHHEVNFRAHDISSGTYIYVLEAGSFREVKRMVYLK